MFFSLVNRPSPDQQVFRSGVTSSPTTASPVYRQNVSRVQYYVQYFTRNNPVVVLTHNIIISFEQYNRYPQRTVRNFEYNSFVRENVGGRKTR